MLHTNSSQPQCNRCVTQQATYAADQVSSMSFLHEKKGDEKRMEGVEGWGRMKHLLRFTSSPYNLSYFQDFHFLVKADGTMVMSFLSRPNKYTCYHISSNIFVWFSHSKTIFRCASIPWFEVASRFSNIRSNIFSIAHLRTLSGYFVKTIVYAA